MLPTLMPGDRVLVLRHWPARWLRKGQVVVVCLAPEDRRPTTAPSYVIKRITGLPGEHLAASIRDGARRLPGRVLDSTRQIWLVPPGHIFIQGDNPLASTDSTNYGPLSTKQLLGVVIVKLPGKADDEQLRRPEQARLLGNGLSEGRPAPPFAAEMLSGEAVTLEDYAGRVVALLFTIPSQLCVELLPGYEALRPYARAAGVELVLVWNDDMEQARRFVDRLRPTLPIVIAPEQDNPLTRDYNIQFWPSYCLIDAEGIVRSCGHPNESAGEWAALAESWRAARAQAPVPATAVGGASRG